MKVIAAVIGFLALTNSAFALSDQQQAQLDRATAAMQASMEEAYREQKAYHAARAAEVKSRCAKLGGASIGMTPDQIYKSCWGRPKKVNETTTARGTHEQWVYGGGYLYLDNGVVTSIQTSR